ncbi:MAG: hypothetical protein K2X66_12570 [Cyanobacteria bacterium]|nr:hypothetical protein [Cyanobacteriota bacterium]
MDINDPRFEQFEERFRALAEQAELVETAKPSLNASRYYLCLYGENGLPPEEEFEFLDKMAAEAGKTLKRLEVDTDYWQDLVLFVP